MSNRISSDQSDGRTVHHRPTLQPTRGQIAAAKLILKRDREGKGRVKITPQIRQLAAYELS